MLTDERIDDIAESDEITGDARYAFARAIEAEVIAPLQARVVQHEIDFALEHDDKLALQAKVDSIRLETLAKERQTAEGFWSLYQAEKAAKKILQAKVAELMQYNSGLCDKSNGYVIEKARLSEKIAEQSAEIERLTKLVSSYRTAWSCGDLEQKLTAENAQQASLIARLEEFQEKAFEAHPNLDLDIEALPSTN